MPKRIQEEQKEQDPYYTSVHEMALLGGKWIGQRLKWSDSEAGIIRLEIFYATPSAIIAKAEEMMAISYPLYEQFRIQNRSDYLSHNLITFALRNENNTFLGIASITIPHNATHPVFIIKMIVTEEFRNANQSSLLLAIEEHVSKSGNRTIATNTRSNIGTEFYIKHGFTLNTISGSLMQYLDKKLQSPSHDKSPRRNSRPVFKI